MPNEEKEIASIDDDMDALYDEIQAREEVPDKTEKEVSEKTERARDEEGKFAKADDKPDVDKEEKQDKKTKKSTEVTEEQKAATEAEVPLEEHKEPEKPVETIRPPSSWSATAKSKFAAMDPDVQKEVLKREDDFHRGIETYKAKAQFADNLYREIQPFEAMIRSQGSTPEVSIRNLLGVAYQLSTGSPQQKQQVISQIAQMYGVELPQNGEEMPRVDPTITALQQEVQRLRQEREQEKYQQESNTTSTLSNEIAEFSKDPKNIYFDNVRADMSALLQAGRAKGLQDAYDMATWANPEVRQLILAQQAKESETKRIEEAKKASLDAKRAAPITTRSKGTVATSMNAGNSIAETMDQVYDDIMSRS